MVTDSEPLNIEIMDIQSDVIDVRVIQGDAAARFTLYKGDVLELHSVYLALIVATIRNAAKRLTWRRDITLVDSVADLLLQEFAPDTDKIDPQARLERQMEAATAHLNGQRLYVLLALFDTRDGSVRANLVRAAREGWERSGPDMQEDGAWDEFDALWAYMQKAGL